MRYLKLASAKNPNTDFIELNDFNGFLCTIFQTIGISRKLEFLEIKNRQFSVSNKPVFKKYSLTIEILTKYSEYEAFYRRLITFLDRNKKHGFRLYFKPYDGMEERYCLCDIETSQRSEKMQPVIVTLQQNSLWLGEERTETTASKIEQVNNLFAFVGDDGYYSAGFWLDEETNDYCLQFYDNISSEAVIENNGFNEIPLNFKIYGPCENPILSLYQYGDSNPIQTTQINVSISEDYYIEIIANILDNGVWYVNKLTNERRDYSERVNNEKGSPYFYIENGKYIFKVEDKGGNECKAEVIYREEYIE